MEIQILGAHQLELKGTRLTSLLIDGTLVVDAGGLTCALSLSEQKKIKTVLLTHHHFDHTRDLVTLAANAGYYWRGQVVVYALPYTLDIVTTCLLDGKIYANFLEYPSKEKPTLILEAIEPYSRKTIAGYNVLAVPENIPYLLLAIKLPLRMVKACFTPAIPQWEYLIAGIMFSLSCLLLELSGPISMEIGSRKLGIFVHGF